MTEEKTGIPSLAGALLARCRATGLRLATAESCTGGMIAAALTDVAGSSDVFERGFVTYANAAKIDMLGVEAAMIAEFGAVSEPVARAMCQGALSRAPVDLAVAVTGIAGPGGGTEAKPVGLVHLAAGRAGGEIRHRSAVFRGGRSAVRTGATTAALAMLLALAEGEP
ncbi:MAG: CinA family protein [Rhodospirillales bacterium]|nr:MAG: CinA family protein [Rhodospirillales bacterium]